MEVLIDVNGQIYSVPTSGKGVRTRHKVTLRYLGSRAGPDVRAERVLACVPVAPEFVTIDDIQKECVDISHDTIRRVLYKFQEEGKVEGIRGKPRGRGRVARHWTRASA